MQPLRFSSVLNITPIRKQQKGKRISHKCKESIKSQNQDLPGLLGLHTVILSLQFTG